MNLFGPKKTTKKYWLEWADQQMKRGISRQDVCLQILEVKVNSVDEARAKSEAERELFGLFVQRNLNGKALEEAGRAAEAVPLYEANVADKFIGQHPYERLRIIYTREHDYTNAIRICQAYLNLPGSRSDKKRDKFQNHLDKLQQAR